MLIHLLGRFNTIVLLLNLLLLVATASASSRLTVSIKVLEEAKAPFAELEELKNSRALMWMIFVMIASTCLLGGLFTAIMHHAIGWGFAILFTALSLYTFIQKFKEKDVQ